MKNKFKVTSEPRAGHVKIFINGLIHLSLDTEQLMCIQTWIGKTYHHVTLYFYNKKPIVLRYGDFYKWEAVIKELNKIEL